MAAIEEDFKHGFDCQKAVVNNLNELFAKKRFWTSSRRNRRKD